MSLESGCRTVSVRRVAGAALCAVLAGMAAPVAMGQAAGPNSQNGSGQGSSGGNIQAVQQVQQQLSQQGPSVTPSTGATDPAFRGSRMTGKATDGVMELTLDEAIQRGLKDNLGLILQSSNEKQASGQKLQGAAGAAADHYRVGELYGGAGEPGGVRVEVSGDQSDYRAVSGDRFPGVPDAEPGESAVAGELPFGEA